MKNLIEILRNEGKPKTFGAIDIIKNIRPGLLVTVGFIDPGNWASNFAAGSSYGYVLLWVVTLSTIMLIALQHNVAHLGIVTGLCLSEATEKYAPHWIGRLILLFTNSYKRIERLIITFVSMIGLSFIYELFLVRIDWPAATQGWVVPSIPEGSMLIVMSVLGAVVMPHNLFLHSELVQSRQINKKDKNSIERALKFELFDTLFSMLVGWAINSAMIILAATTFFSSHQVVDDLSQAQALLTPLLGNNAANIFAIALFLAGISSTITSGMAAGCIFSGMFGEQYYAKDAHSIVGICLSLGLALLVIFFVGDPFKGLLYSQMVLSIQLPFTMFLQVWLTSNSRVMGDYVNHRFTKWWLYFLSAIVTVLNIWLFATAF